MTKRLLDRLFEPEAGPQAEAQHELRLPTLDKRASLYLRAVHEKNDFTHDEYASARSRILDAMAANIAGNMEDTISDPIVVPPFKPIEDAKGHLFQSHESARTSVNLEAALLSGVVRARASIRTEITGELNLAQPQSALSQKPIVANSAAWKRSKRTISICTAAGLAAVIALFLVTTIPTGRFTTNPSLLESQVAVQSLPQKTEIQSVFQGGPKQVETTSAPLGAQPALSDIRKVVPTNQIDADEIADLVKRGRELVAARDILTARLVLKRAAEAGDASAALELGATYDPIVLQEYSDMTIASDIAEARAWYLTARELGSAEASKRLERLPGAVR
jgi:hypothetical protein